MLLKVKKGRFVIKEEHMKLLNRMFINWESGEFGAPSVDCKRPYGNSDVYDDIAEILGIERSRKDGDFTDKQINDMRQLHEEMQAVLQILVRNAGTGIKAGDVFFRENCWDDWEKKNG